MEPQEGKMRQLIPIETIEKHILLVQGHKVLLDEDLANSMQLKQKISIRQLSVTENVSRNISCFNLQKMNLNL